MSDIVTGRVFQDGEKGITAQKLNDITASSVIQPSFYTSKPTASTADPPDVMLLLKAGAYTQVPVSTLASSLSNAAIWSVRLRSFNAIGNPNFEVDQRNGGLVITSAPQGFIQDRWFLGKSGTMAVNSSGNQAGPIVVPGTSFNITNSNRNLVLTTQQSSLAATNALHFYQLVEGTSWRELAGDVTSISLLVYTSVAGLQFSVYLRSSDTTVSLVKLCTVPAANTWTLISLPNIPKPTGGVFSINSGILSYYLGICLAAGSTFIAPVADTWQNGNFLGAPGMSNWAGSPVNSTFYCAFVQHEPGPVCSILIDKPFTQNYDECLRYYAKGGYNYGTKPGTAGFAGGYHVATSANAANPRANLSWPKPMANVPTVSIWAIDGTANAVTDDVSGGAWPVTGAGGVSSMGMGHIILSGTPTASRIWQFHYAADTGW